MMKKNLLVCATLISGVACYAAELSESLEHRVYAFHNPGEKLTLHVERGPAEDRTLSLQMRSGALASQLLTLRENQLLIDGESRLEHISIHTAGGYPLSKQLPYRYLPKQRYYILQPHLGPLLEKTEDDDARVHEPTFLASLQSLKTCAEVLDACKDLKTAALIVSLREWKRLNYTKEERGNLPAAYVAPTMISLFDVDDQPAVLTKAQWLAHKASSRLCILQ